MDFSWERMRGGEHTFGRHVDGAGCNGGSKLGVRIVVVVVVASWYGRSSLRNEQRDKESRRALG